MTSERAQVILAAKGKGLFGSFGIVIEEPERLFVEKVQDRLLTEYSGKRYIFWDEALAYLATGEVPPEQPK